MSGKVTLKQIAEQAGVSLTTVHRVLNNKEGCSEALKQKILAIAKAEGYTINLAASSLRKQTMHIALIAPARNSSSRYFCERIWDGYLQFRNEVSQFNVVFQEYYIEGADVDAINSGTVSTLKNIYMERPTHYDGLLIYGLLLDETAAALVNRIVGSGTKVIILERSPESLSDICSVTVNDCLSGSMAGELLARAVHGEGSVLILNQKLPGGDPNGRACAQTLAKEHPGLHIHTMDLALDTPQQNRIQEKIASLPGLAGIYSTCARHTVSMLRALENFPSQRPVLVGSELFEESYQALHSHQLDVVIDKRPAALGYKAAQLLFSNLVKGEALPANCKVTPRIVLRANSDCYYKKQDV